MHLQAEIVPFPFIMSVRKIPTKLYVWDSIYLNSNL